MNHVCVDGKIIPGGQPVFYPDNRAYRYGDGLFETMKMIHGKICLASLHFERFFSGLKLLEFPVPVLLTPEKLAGQVAALCQRNECAQLARIRLSASRGNGGLYDGNGQFHYLIECWPAAETVNQLNENGLIIGIYPDARKSCDIFSNLKSANYLPYVMAAHYAKANKFNDCLVLNARGHIADATIANVFALKDRLIITPALAEGCVNGVMRKYLLEKINAEDSGLTVQERPLSIEDLLLADEVFLTNAMNGIRWVKQIGKKNYKNALTADIYNRYVKTIWE